MTPINSARAGSVEPIFASVKDAATALGLSTFVVYQLLDEGQIESQYFGRRRLVVIESLKAFARGLPTERPEAS